MTARSFASSQEIYLQQDFVLKAVSVGRLPTVQIAVSDDQASSQIGERSKTVSTAYLLDSQGISLFASSGILEVFLS
jgi:hypothetical protein